MKNHHLVLVSAVVLAFSLLYSHDVEAVTYDLKDQESCKSISGTWSDSTSTCTVSNLYLNSGNVLTIDNSVYANISLAIIQELDNSGIINNSGTIIINSVAVIYNDGYILNYCTAGCIGGTIENDGTLINKKDGSITSNSTIDNSGALNNSGNIVISTGGSINNLDKIINNGGTINNFGNIHNNQLSSIINTGGTINNYVTILNDPKGTITNSGTITNMCDGTVNNDGDVLGTPIVNVTCNPPNSLTVSEFSFAMPIFVISIGSLIAIYRIKIKN